MRTSLESIQVHLSVKKIKLFFVRKFFKNFPPIFPIFRFEARYRSSKMSSLTSIHMYFRELSLSLSFSLSLCISLSFSLSFSEIQRYQYNVGSVRACWSWLTAHSVCLFYLFSANANMLPNLTNILHRYWYYW